MATPIIMPRLGQSVESCILVEWKVKPGQAVKAGAIVAEIETDKAVLEVESPVDGTILELFAEKDAEVPVLAAIAAVGEPGEDVSSLRPAQAGPEGGKRKTVESGPAPVAATAPPAAAPTTTGTAAVSPRARQRAEALGVDAAHLAGSGPGGRIIERDVEAAAAARGRLSPAAKGVLAGGGHAAPVTGSGPGGMVLAGDLREEEAGAAPAIIPVRGVRKIIAERMRASLAGTAQLTLHRSFDATAMQAYRAQAKERGGTAPTINDLIVYATVRTLVRHPALNAHFLGDRMAQYACVNMGIAVDTPRGLMVPVVRHAERLGLEDLAQTIRTLARACEEGAIQPDQLAGGTFTLTNLGALGIESFTPVLNAPEVAILGVGGLFLKPVPGPEGVRHVPAMNLSLTIDHQAVDGAPGARFLQDLAAALENLEQTLKDGTEK